MGANPQMAIGIIPIALIVFLMVYVIWCTITGKGKPVLSEPYCAKCGYDLRVNWDSSMACPECGADLKARHAVNFGKAKGGSNHKWIIYIAILIMLFLVTLVLSRVSTGGRPRAVTAPTPIQSTPR